MRIQLLTILLFYQLLANAQDNIPPIGLWREHLPYHSAIDITAGSSKIYCATPYSLFSVSMTDNSTERYSRITGLSETGISAIQYNTGNDKLVIAYTNSNIDILYRNDVYNIPDIKRDNIAGDKTIYTIYARSNRFYLSTGLGVIVLDADKYEVADTWFIGNTGGQVRINGFTSDNSFFYAATAEGLKKVPINSANPANYANWHLISGSNGLAPGACQHVFTVQNNVVVQKDDSLFVQNGNNWSLLYTDGWKFINSNNTSGHIQLCESLPNGSSRVVVLSSSGTVINTITALPLVQPHKAIQYNNETWVADSVNSLLHYKTGNIFSVAYTINSPRHIATGEMVSYNSMLKVAAGSVTNTWLPQNNTNGLYRFAGGEWKNINKKAYPLLDSIRDFSTLAIDKRDETVWAGSFGGGLLHVKQDNSFEVFKQNFIGFATNNTTAYNVSGLAFDNEYNLWISNYGASQPLRVKKADGSWKAFSLPFAVNENALSQIVVDDNNYKWMVAPKGNGLVCFSHGNSIDNTADDQWRRLGIGSGNLPSNTILCVAKDKEGFIWIGTADGVAVMQCPELVFATPACDAVLPVVPNGSFAGYLLKGQEVRSIAADGANRKWIASNKGVFLVSEDGEKVVYQFTEENSPLLSNDVRSIAIDGKTGEVFFATGKGICSFRSTATEGAEQNETVLVFPNPVPPGYTGTIAIRGLVNNAMVKITELDGKLVYQTRALGGQAVWDGKNYRGQRIVSGAYLVLVTDNSKKERVATKIFYISK